MSSVPSWHLQLWDLSIDDPYQDDGRCQKVITEHDGTVKVCYDLIVVPCIVLTVCVYLSVWHNLAMK